MFSVLCIHQQIVGNKAKEEYQNGANKKTRGMNSFLRKIWRAAFSCNLHFEIKKKTSLQLKQELS